ncbi:MAG: prolipoprotein diacylglyceryl transferase [Desulfosarcinaceae bacterium]|nr:prolipoprotein diacylglyceryl transferase [Desulfosarcinaceae bacterium]
MDSFWQWWQHLPSTIDPVIFSIGPFKLQYYGMMYLVAFGVTYLLVRYRLAREPRFDLSLELVQGLLTAMIVGLILGARLGYVAFYNAAYYIAHPLEIFLPFDFSNGIRFTGISGMSYHGGLIGVILAALYFTRRNRLSFLEMADLFIPAIPLGYTFGRLGNFINGELYGRVTTAKIGMLFPQAGDGLMRHPSQLYEAFFEGIVLFALLWSLRQRVRMPGALLGMYLIGYGVVRFFIEYVRQPDDHLGLVWQTLSMGQLLCAAMILCGIGVLVWVARRRESDA